MKRACLLLVLCACPTLPGIEDSGTPPRPVAGPVIDLAAGATHACANTADGGVWCWGCYCSGGLLTTLTEDSRPVPVAGIRNPRQLALGLDFGCALLLDSTVSCWGRGGAGQLGNGATEDSNTAVPVTGLTGVLEIAAGDRHVCARLNDGSISCWGDNRKRQLGDMTIDDQKSTPTSLGIFGATQLELGATHSCARRASGTVLCWGDNTAGQLGDGTMLERNTPTPVLGNLSGTRVAAGGARSCLLGDERSVSCWGDGEVSPVEVLASDAGFTEPDDAGSPQLSVGGAYTCVRSKDTVHCLDAGSFMIPGARQVVGGGGFSCARTAVGEVFCWGKNDVGQLGNGTQGAASLTPVRVEF